MKNTIPLLMKMSRDYNTRFCNLLDNLDYLTNMGLSEEEALETIEQDLRQNTGIQKGGEDEQ